MNIQFLSLLIPLLLLGGGMVIVLLTWAFGNGDKTVHPDAFLAFFSGIGVGWIFYSITILIMREIALRYLGV